MKKTNVLKILFLMLILPKLVSAVQINQVLYDPSGSESTSEAIELYNPASSSVDISGWIIATETSSTDAVIPANTIISPGGYYLVTDTGWNGSKDSSWRSADHEETITLNNDNSGIALKDSNSTVIDAVGWGTASGIKNNLYEGTPANDLSEGKALLRKNDTDNNINDFVEALPDFSDPNSIRLNVNVTNQSSSGNASNITMSDDDSGKQGIQISPVSGGTKRVKLVAVASGGVTATFLNKTIQFNSTGNNTYEGYLELDYHLAPGNYTVYINDEQVGFEYLPLMDLRVQANRLSFNAVPGKEKTTRTPCVIKNTGNVDFTLAFESSGLVNGNSTISADNLKISMNKEDFYELGEGITISPGKEKEIYFSLFVPQGTKTGLYSSIITLTAEEN